MKISAHLSYALIILTLAACVNRETEKDEDAIRLEAQEDTTKSYMATEYELPNTEATEVNKAKKVINAYYGALGRSANREAYDMMDPETDRGSFSEFSERQSSFENVSVTYTEAPEVIIEADSSYTVKVPIRVTGTTATGSSESYKGTATLKRNQGTPNSDYRITMMELNREDS